MSTVREEALRARGAALWLQSAPLAQRNAALLGAAQAIEANAAAIGEANARDLAAAQREGLAQPLIKRLRFDTAKLAESVAGLRALAALPDPLEHTQMATELMPGLSLYRVSCPIGVVGVIFESRPDALVQIAGLCLKSGNASLLKGGREALETNRALFEAMDGAARGAGLPGGWACLLETREDVSAMLGMDDCIDLLIPRGSNAFVRHILDNSRIPVLGHADGLCHVYVDAQADLAQAVRIAVDSKAQYVAVCNACETLLVHAQAAHAFLPVLQAAMAAAGVTLRGCARTRAIIDCGAATDVDWDTEYLDYVLSIKVVDSVEEAIAHINRHGSGHTDVICTQCDDTAALFMRHVDSAGVFQNCSSRFSDGFRYGFGAEVGVATGKLHARGPMGLEGLCSYKYKLIGHGQTVREVSEGALHFTHRPLDEACPR